MTKIEYVAASINLRSIYNLILEKAPDRVDFRALVFSRYFDRAMSDAVGDLREMADEVADLRARVDALMGRAS